MWDPAASWSNYLITMRGPVRRSAEQARRHSGTLRLPFAQVPTEVSPVASRLHCTTRPLDLLVTRDTDRQG